MPSDFPGSPRFLKGALAVYESDSPGVQAQPKIIVFQYNPDQLRRRLEKRATLPQRGNVGAAREDVLRSLGPPMETITLTIVLDAADQLEDPKRNQTVVNNGLHPVLAMLEMLLYPPTARVLENQNLAKAGQVQISLAKLPLALLIWGQSRVVPIVLSSFSVTEEAFDQELNPIHAQVELDMRVLTYMELQQRSLGRDTYIAYQQRKESLARLYQSSGDESRRIRGLLPS